MPLSHPISKNRGIRLIPVATISCISVSGVSTSPRIILVFAGVKRIPLSKNIDMFRVCPFQAEYAQTPFSIDLNRKLFFRGWVKFFWCAEDSDHSFGLCSVFLYRKDEQNSRKGLWGTLLVLSVFVRYWCHAKTNIEILG